MKKLEFGFTTALNEEECISAWIKQALYFCEKVLILVDPITTDNTIEIIKSYQDRGFPIEYKMQDRDLGDSDRYMGGKKKIAIWHANQNECIKQIPVGQWYFFSDIDELLDPNEWPQILHTICQCISYDSILDGFLMPKIEFYPDEHHIINWTTIGIERVLHSVFRKRVYYQERGLDPHGSITFPKHSYTLDFPIYHFTNLKKDAQRKWYDYIPSSDMNTMLKKFGSIQTTAFDNPIVNWRN